MLSPTALKELSAAAQYPAIVFSGNPLHPYDAPIVAELLPLGLIQVEKPGWYEVSAAGYAFVEQCGISIWRLTKAVYHAD